MAGDAISEHEGGQAESWEVPWVFDDLGETQRRSGLFAFRLLSFEIDISSVLFKPLLL